jgi:hypothetical protein
MPLRAIARLIQTMLYARRFFPYYVYNILGGIEEDGELNPSFESFPKSALTYIMKVPAPSTLSTLWDPMNAKLVVQREPHNLLCNRSSIIRRVSE